MTIPFRSRDADDIDALPPDILAGVDLGSLAIAAQFLRRGHMLPSEALRQGAVVLEKIVEHVQRHRAGSEEA